MLLRYISGSGYLLLLGEQGLANEIRAKVLLVGLVLSFVIMKQLTRFLLDRAKS